MKVTLLLTLAGCALLFLAIWAATVTQPFKSLARNFPEDVQQRLKPRLDAQRMTAKRFFGGILVIILLLGYAGLYVSGGIDGMRNGFNLGQFFLRFVIISAGVKLFDILGLDFFLLTKTRFFQHYFPETEGCEGWQQFGYNRRQQMRQIIAIPVYCLLLAWLFTYLS